MEEIKAPAPANHKRKIIAALIFAIIAIVGGITGYLYIQYKKIHITTDDAFIEGRIHTVSSKVLGTIKNIYVTDNQFVRKGAVLVEVDSEDFDVRVREASSALDAERTRLSELKYRLDASRQRFEELQAIVEAARANLELQEANMRQAEIDIKRAENLFREDFISKERYEKTKTGYDITLAQVKAANGELRQAEASLETQKALIKQTEAAIEPQRALIRQKEASLRAAELNRSYTKVYAPSDGYITRKSVESGNQVQAGQPLMAVVPLGDIWVVANYKETQLEKVRPGQRVEIKVDTYPKRIFKGRVDSVMAGTGAVFSLFPPENATGSYVKVVQRIPVKIVFEKGTDAGHVLRIGMSVVPTIIIKD
ncbi:MAG: HlyD family secretion protein [Nitrospirae bacterium]|nr:HlyD family secretion protein [Nitrospirota bacterium]